MLRHPISVLIYGEAKLKILHPFHQGLRRAGAFPKEGGWGIPKIVLTDPRGNKKAAYGNGSYRGLGRKGAAIKIEIGGEVPGRGIYALGTGEAKALPRGTSTLQLKDRPPPAVAKE